MIDALRYEVVRLRTIRSTYWLIGLALTFQLIMSMIIAWRLSITPDPLGPDNTFAVLATIGASTGIAPLFIGYVLGMLGVFSMGHEYRHGMIRATLTALPSRVAVLAAKVITTAVITALGALACIAMAFLSIAVWGLGLPAFSEVRDLTLGTVIFTVLFSLSGLAYATIVRNQTAAVALLLLVPTLIETIIRGIVFVIKAASDDPQSTSGVVEILKYLPYDAGGQLYTRASIGDLLSFLGYVPFGPVGGGLVMGTFVAILMALAAWRFLRFDA